MHCRLSKQVLSLRISQLEEGREARTSPSPRPSFSQLHSTQLIVDTANGP